MAGAPPPVNACRKEIRMFFRSASRPAAPNAARSVPFAGFAAAGARGAGPSRTGPDRPGPRPPGPALVEKMRRQFLFCRRDSPASAAQGRAVWVVVLGRFLSRPLFQDDGARYCRGTTEFFRVQATGRQPANAGRCVQSASIRTGWPRATWTLSVGWVGRRVSPLPEHPARRPGPPMLIAGCPRYRTLDVQTAPTRLKSGGFLIVPKGLREPQQMTSGFLAQGALA